MAMPSLLPPAMIAGQGLSESLGKGLGGGLSSGLQAIANMKLQQMQQRHQQQNYAQSSGKLFELFGVSPDKAQELGMALGGLSPQERNHFWQNPSALSALTMQSQQQGQPLAAMNTLTQQPIPEMPNEQIIGPYEPYNPNIQGPQGGAVPQTQPTSQPQQPNRATQFAEAFISPQEKRAQEMLGLARKKETRAEQKDLQPFITKVTERAERWKNIRGKAEKAFELLEKAKNKFPGWLTGNLPESVQPWVIRDPDVRDYQSLILEMIPIIAAEGDDKRLTNLKLQLTKAAKPNVSQPIKTQMDVLQGIIDLSDEKKDINHYMLSLEDKGTGNYPNDLKSRVSEFSEAQEEPLKYPRYFKHNTIIEDKGKLFMNINGKRWKQLKG